jgi:hypothetical protein
MQCHILHAVSYFARDVNDTAYTVHAVSMTPHTFKKIQISSRIQIYIRKDFSPLIRGPRTDVLMKKIKGRKSRDTVPLKDCIAVGVVSKAKTGNALPYKHPQEITLANLNVHKSASLINYHG